MTTYLVLPPVCSEAAATYPNLNNRAENKKTKPTRTNRPRRSNSYHGTRTRRRTARVGRSRHSGATRAAQSLAEPFPLDVLQVWLLPRHLSEWLAEHRGDIVCTSHPGTTAFGLFCGLCFVFLLVFVFLLLVFFFVFCLCVCFC